MKKYTTYEKLQCEVVTGAGHVIQCLKKLGVTTFFAYPGGAILPVYDKLYESGLKQIVT
ncbi:thiamine pyrophosphate-binding protein, partial [Lysinibacillus sp. D4A1_S13]|uniref:thiamine pyrophosphate-binding protein n=1 Tax=Lysinibacillus sp. D4A1_S13 TaxID=2941228 RepID=UPI0020BDA329